MLDSHVSTGRVPGLASFTLINAGEDNGFECSDIKTIHVAQQTVTPQHKLKKSWWHPASPSCSSSLYYYTQQVGAASWAVALSPDPTDRNWGWKIGFTSTHCHHLSFSFRLQPGLLPHKFMQLSHLTGETGGSHRWTHFHPPVSSLSSDIILKGNHHYTWL